jgi:serine protease Do
MKFPKEEASMSITKTKLMSTAGLIGIGVLVGIIASSNLHWTPTSLASKPDSPAISSPASSVPQAVIDMQNTGKAFTAVAKEVIPCVVSISTSKLIKRTQANEDLPPMFREFFGQGRDVPETEKLQGLGSGVLVSADGYILTNNHVIENADDILVTMSDNNQLEAKKIGADPLTDVAVIKVEGKKFPAARLGDSEQLEVGEWVLAIGSPLDLSLASTVTAGIVSAKGRAIGIIQDQDAQRTGGSSAIENFIQTDAAINPGNSGGALVNLKGEVVGINTAIASRSGGYQGYGFAIPVNLAKKIMNDLIGKGFVTRAWMGISMRPVNEAMSQRFKMDRPKGVLVKDVLKDSPAEKAGLKSLDIILKVDGQEMNKSNEVQNYIALKNPGETVKILVLRDGKEREIAVKLGQKDLGKDEKPESKDEEVPGLGMKLKTLDGDLRSQLDLGSDVKGVVVTDVEAYSAAGDAGIVRGDIITKIEDKPIASVGDYTKAVKQFKKGDVVIFYFQRKDYEDQAFVKIPK